MGNYTLQKYKGTATRHTCPSCGDKRSFTYYVDESGTPLHPSVGRCNHESSCGYHYTPKEISMTTPNAVLPTVYLLAGRGQNGSLCRYHHKQP